MPLITDILPSGRRREPIPSAASAKFGPGWTGMPRAVQRSPAGMAMGAGEEPPGRPGAAVSPAKAAEWPTRENAKISENREYYKSIAPDPGSCPRYRRRQRQDRNFFFLVNGPNAARRPHQRG